MLALTAAILVGAAVAVAGLIGFVGLLFRAQCVDSWPFKPRTATGQRARRGCLSILCDLVARTIHPPTEIRLGECHRSLRRPAFYLFASSSVSRGGKLVSVLETRKRLSGAEDGRSWGLLRSKSDPANARA